MGAAFFGADPASFQLALVDARSDPGRRLQRLAAGQSSIEGCVYNSQAAGDVLVTEVTGEPVRPHRKPWPLGDAEHPVEALVGRG